jgi:protein gp37
MAKRMHRIFEEKWLAEVTMLNEGHDNRRRFTAYNGGIPWLNTNELSAPLRRKKPARIGVQLMGDLFHESIPFEWIAAIYGVMAASPQHQFFTLTKRPERRFEFFEWLDKSPVEDARQIRACLTASDMMIHGMSFPYPKAGPRGHYLPWPLPNVLEGTSVEDQKTADERIPWLPKTPAAKRWISYEPALGPVDWDLLPFGARRDTAWWIDLIVAGAETGPGARPAELDWFRSARDQCAEACVPFFFKRDSSGSRLLDGRLNEEVV